jgi:predicted ribosomally synthesized peptide with SipW-like signal peptide
MKNVVLSIMVLAALVAAGIGGTLADFSDIEVSEDNYFNIGSLDLAVSDGAGTTYNGDTIPAFVQYEGAWPNSDKSYWVDLHNYGQGTQYVPYVYLHFKNVECHWVYPKINYMWVNEDGTEADPADVPAPPDPTAGWQEGDQGTGYPKPVTEPEYRAEYGGLIGELPDGTLVETDGIGPQGEDCNLDEYVEVLVEVSNATWAHDALPDPSQTLPVTQVYSGMLSDLECTPLCLGQLQNCNGRWVHIVFQLQEPSEEDFQMDLFPDDSPWNDWVTNAFQKDGVSFDMAFEIFQSRLANIDCPFD